MNKEERSKALDELFKLQDELGLYQQEREELRETEVFKPWHDGLKLHDPEYPIEAELTYRSYAGVPWIYCSNCDNEFSYELWQENPDWAIKAHYKIHEMNKNAKD